ncbi:MAG: SDR family oxidoreductase [Roseibacillus sp.]
MNTTESPLLVVTGSTGQLGGLIVRALVDRYPADRIVATTRVPEQADELRSLGVRVRWADYEQPESLAEAFVGVGRILVVSSNARASGGDPLVQHRAVFDTAKKAGAQRIVFTSQMAASASSPFPPMRDYAASEAILAECGVPFTILRHGFYGTSGIQMMADALTTGQLTTAQDGKISWVAHRDLAEAAALILTGEAAFEGATPPLTGPEALDFADLAALVSQLQEKQITHTILSDDAMRAPFVAGGIPDSIIEMVLGLYLAARNDAWNSVDPTLQNLLGRPLITMREQLEHAFAE